MNAQEIVQALRIFGGDAVDRLYDDAAFLIERLTAENDLLRDTAENLIIAIGMGWDLDGVIEKARAALAGKDEG